MASSGTRTFNPVFADIIGEAFARIQIRGLQITQDHISEAMTSANLMFVALHNQGFRQYAMLQDVISLTQGDPTYSLPAGALDVMSVVYQKDGLDTPVWPFSRTDYHHIPDKTNEGRPFNYFVDKQGLGNTQRSITLWPTPDTTGDFLDCWFLMKNQDVGTMVNDLSVGYEFFDVYASALTARLAEKFAPQLFAEKSVLASAALESAMQGQRERAPTRLRMRGYTYGRRGGRR